MFRLTKELGYQHVSDFLADDQASTELPGWIEYCKMDDEMQTMRIARAIMMAFRVEKKPSVSLDDDEKVIDTTTAEFREHFKGFTNTPQTGRPPQRFHNNNTEIKMG